MEMQLASSTAQQQKRFKSTVNKCALKKCRLRWRKNSSDVKRLAKRRTKAERTEAKIAEALTKGVLINRNKHRAYLERKFILRLHKVLPSSRQLHKSKVRTSFFMSIALLSLSGRTVRDVMSEKHRTCIQSNLLIFDDSFWDCKNVKFNRKSLMVFEVQGREGIGSLVDRVTLLSGYEFPVERHE